MALNNTYNGNNNNGNGGNKQSSVNVYSPYKMSNVEGIDPSALNFTFCLNMLKLSISPKKPGDQIAFDHEKAIECFLTHGKAKMLSDEIKYMLSHKGEVHSVSVNTGRDGLVEFNDGISFGLDHPVLVLRKIGEDGKPVSNYAYEFKNDYHFNIRNYDPENPTNFDRVVHDQLEIDQFLTILDEYVKAITGAVAYSVLENGKFNQGRTDGKLNSIMEKLGVEYNSNRGGANYSRNNNSFFNNNQGNASYRQGTLDDFTNTMNTPEDVE